MTVWQQPSVPGARRASMLAGSVPVLGGLTLTVLMPAAHAAKAGAFTHALPWVVLALMSGAPVAALAERSGRRQTR